MRKYLRVLGASLLLLASAGVVNSAPITLTDTTNFYKYGTDSSGDLLGSGGKYVNKLEYITDFVSWKHEYTFDPAAEQLLSGTLSLWLADDGGIFDWFEFAFGYGEDGSWDLGEVNTGVFDYGLDVSSLEDGRFEVTLVSAGGDFYIHKSVLEIQYIAVPEPGALALFGAGLLGLVLARRRTAGK